MKDTKSNIQPSDFSRHLFWDVDIEKVNLEQSKKWLIERVLEYGLLSDWRKIKEIFGLEEIKKIALELRSMDDVTLSFLCLLFDLEPNNFRCYTRKQSIPDFWKS
ncbi:hypothetical protein E4S40_01715 [Algoriphagus kandeliae]|uniref:DUF6922 domain-containing protein n=1 Tax=Algoriphagus kandeliae TaxID=2562278 RepID=A0A4Y9QYF6_9BACT|nr:hypothetical protein E4S40_01715 [Algoriphagus kandeliae]